MKLYIVLAIFLFAQVGGVLGQAVKGTYFLEFNFRAIEERNRRMGLPSSGRESNLESVVLHWSLIQSDQPALGR